MKELLSPTGTIYVHCDWQVNSQPDQLAIVVVERQLPGQSVCDMHDAEAVLDLERFAADCGYDGPPFRWDEHRRFLLRCELDAAYFHLYGLSRADAAYILDTFPIVKRKDEQQYGTYRTKDQILAIYDAMQQAIDTGKSYQTLLDPPPADPRCAHPPREVTA